MKIIQQVMPTPGQIYFRRVDAPTAGPGSAQAAAGNSELAHRKNQMNFKRYARGLMKYMKAQNGKSKGDSSHAQTP